MFDEKVTNGFDAMFDINRDGKLDIYEEGLKLEYMMQELDSGMSSDDNDFETEAEDELEMAGLDYDELSCMDEDDRNELLEDAGLDPDDYDF